MGRKLVRDHVPGLEEKDLAIAGTIEMRRLFRAKLLEEYEEWLQAVDEGNDSGMVEELADLYELVFGMTAYCGQSMQEVTTHALAKMESHGGFYDRIVWTKAADKLGSKVLSPLTLDAVAAEAIRAHYKHAASGGSFLDPGLTVTQRLAALMEEVGEVGRELTYDNTQDNNKLVKELIHVANVALTWVEFLEGGGRPELFVYQGGGS